LICVFSAKGAVPLRAWQRPRNVVQKHASAESVIQSRRSDMIRSDGANQESSLSN
jgi:hypothetical protein